MKLYYKKLAKNLLDSKDSEKPFVFDLFTFKCSYFSGLSRWKNFMDGRPVYVIFLVDKVALGEDFLPVLRLSLVIIFPPVFHTHSFISVRLCATLPIESHTWNNKK